MPVGNDDFRAALSRFPSGVTVVTVMDGAGALFGITVSSFCSVSLNPPLVLVCIEKGTGSHHALIDSDVFVVNILAEGQAPVSNHFASTLDDKFSAFSFHEGKLGLPLLDDALANLECRRVSYHDEGDHTIFIGRVEHVELNDEKPLVYWRGSYRLIE